MGKKDKVKLTKEKKEIMVEKIKKYYFDERDEAIGDLAAGIFLDFIINDLAIEFYNQGVYDSFLYMNDRCEDLLSIQK
ncbi:MAG: hypothetical protein K0Q97_2966 [Bacillota bacterium]|jgi:uncharacterized protein (DUF2164 family)|nr:hypothetical protein [Bacillota bacterium]